MTLETADVAHILIALAVLMVAAHAVGSVFVRFRQPRAIGEVLGGLLLGATVLGHFWPSATAWIFPAAGATPTVLAAVNQLGLLLLLFITGTEIRRVFHRRSQRTVGCVFLAGMVIPFVAGVALLQVIDGRSHWGPNGN
jgi:Kef-type K+ transport system membrane component KefB